MLKVHSVSLWITFHSCCIRTVQIQPARLSCTCVKFMLEWQEYMVLQRIIESETGPQKNELSIAFKGYKCISGLVWSTIAKEVIKICIQKNDLCLAVLILHPFSQQKESHTFTVTRDTLGWLVLLMLAHLCYGTRAASLALITALSFPCKHQPTSPCIPIDWTSQRQRRRQEGWRLLHLFKHRRAKHQNTSHKYPLCTEFTTLKARGLMMLLKTDFSYIQKIGLKEKLFYWEMINQIIGSSEIKQAN